MTIIEIKTNMNVRIILLQCVPVHNDVYLIFEKWQATNTSYAMYCLVTCKSNAHQNK